MQEDTVHACVNTVSIGKLKDIFVVTCMSCKSARVCKYRCFLLEGGQRRQQKDAECNSYGDGKVVMNEDEAELCQRCIRIQRQRGEERERGRVKMQCEGNVGQE